MRDWVGQWEALVNQHGTELLQKPEVARVVQGATSAGLQLQGSVHEAMGKALAAANLPSRADLEALATRLSAIEATLARIEAATNATAAPPARARPTPRRTRQPG